MKFSAGFKIRIFGFIFLLFLAVSCAKLKDGADKKVVSSRIGQRFYDITKLSRNKGNKSALITYPRPELYKTYPSGIKKIKLSLPEFEGLTVEKAIRLRRSKRQDEVFAHRALSFDELSRLLLSASGITGRNQSLELRAAPSAGALYPIEIYLVVNNVFGLSRGIYHYAVRGHALELIEDGDFRDEIERAVMHQPGVRDSAVVFIFSAIPGRTTAKYDLRGWRYVYMEVGYISENLYLEATSLGLSTTAMGAFYDEELNHMLGLDGRKEMVLHVQIFGGRDVD